MSYSHPKSAKGKRAAKKAEKRMAEMDLILRHNMFRDERIAALRAVEGCMCAECKDLRVKLAAKYAKGEGYHVG